MSFSCFFLKDKWREKLIENISFSNPLINQRCCNILCKLCAQRNTYVDLLTLKPIYMLFGFKLIDIYHIHRWIYGFANRQRMENTALFTNDSKKEFQMRNALKWFVAFWLTEKEFPLLQRLFFCIFVPFFANEKSKTDRKY